MASAAPAAADFGGGRVSSRAGPGALERAGPLRRHPPSEPPDRAGPDGGSTPWGLCSQFGSKGVRETLQVQIGVAGAASPPPRRARAELWPPRDSHQSSPRLGISEFMTRTIRVHDSDSAARAKSSDARRSELISELE